MHVACCTQLWCLTVSTQAIEAVCLGVQAPFPHKRHAEGQRAPHLLLVADLGLPIVLPNSIMLQAMRASLTLSKQLRRRLHLPNPDASAEQAVFGIGVGGEYPIASTSASERAEADVNLQHRRGETVMLTFSMQGAQCTYRCAATPASCCVNGRNNNTACDGLYQFALTVAVRWAKRAVKHRGMCFVPVSPSLRIIDAVRRSCMARS